LVSATRHSECPALNRGEDWLTLNVRVFNGMNCWENQQFGDRGGRVMSVRND
jgi:hypothetical protein